MEQQDLLVPPLPCLLERCAAVVVPLEHTLGIGGDDRLAHAEVPSHGREMERLVSALATCLRSACTGGNGRLGHGAKRAPAGCVVQRQPALPRVVLLREQPRLLADEAELERARTRSLTECVVQLVAVSLHVQIVVMLQLRQGPSALRAASLLHHGLRVVDLCVVGLLHLTRTLRASAWRSSVLSSSVERNSADGRDRAEQVAIFPTGDLPPPRNDSVLTTSTRGVPGRRVVRPQPPQPPQSPQSPRRGRQAPRRGGAPPRGPRR